MKVSSWELEEKLCAMKDVKLPFRIETTWIVIISWHLSYQIGIVGCVHSFFLYCHSFLPWECRWHWFKSTHGHILIPLVWTSPVYFVILGKILETHLLGMYPRCAPFGIYTLHGASPIIYGWPQNDPRNRVMFSDPDFRIPDRPMVARWRRAKRHLEKKGHRSSSGLMNV